MISAWSQLSRQALLDGFVTGVIAPSQGLIRPYTNNIVPTPQSLIGDFVFGADSILMDGHETFGPSGGTVELAINEAGEEVLVQNPGQSYSDVTTGVPGVPTSIFGFVVQGADTIGALLYAKSLDEPIALLFSGQAFSIPVSLSLANDIGGS